MKNVSQAMEKKLVVSLFADLSNFTALCQRIENEDVIEVVNISFSLLNKVVQKYKGIIHKYEGDAILCLFGYPTNYENMAESAVSAAHEMMKVVPEIEKRIYNSIGIEVELGLHIGITSGMVIIGEIGVAGNKEHTLMGNSVNYASRLKDIAKDGEILVSSSIYKLTAYMFEYQPLSALFIKGIGNDVEVYKFIGVKEKVELKRGIKGLFSPIVGRDKEINFLKKRVDEFSKDKLSRLIFILGDAGIGKSRLLRELKNRIKKKGISFYEVQCIYRGEGFSYWTILELLEKILDITDTDTQEDIKSKIIMRLKHFTYELQEEILPYIAHLFAVNPGKEREEKIKFLKPQQLRTKLLSSIKQFLSVVALESPFIIAIEDYHWIDSESLEVIKFLFNSSQPIEQVMLIALSRIERDGLPYKTKELFRETWKDRFSEIVLEPLSKRYVIAITNNLLSIMNIPESLRELILKKSHGNPFFLEEIVRTLIDREVIVYSNGTWNAKKNIEDIHIPDTIQILIETRFDRLDANDKHVLKIASVTGITFEKGIIEFVVEKDFELNSSLKRLTTLEFIKEDDVQESTVVDRYKFKHPIIQEVVYNNLIRQEKAKLHEKVGHAIETLYKDRTEDFVEVIATHYANSNNYEKAIFWLKKAGEKSKKNFANKSAIKYYEQIVNIVNKFKPQDIDDLILAFESIADIHQLRGNYTSAIKFYKNIINIKDDFLIHARIRRKIAGCYHRQSMYDEAIDILEEVEASLLVNKASKKRHKKVKDLLTLLYHDFAWIYYLKGEYDRAFSFCEKALKEGNDEEKDDIATIYNIIAAIKSRTGEQEEAFDYYRKAQKVYEAKHDLAHLGTIYNNFSSFFANKGDFETAIDYLNRSLDIAKRIGDGLSEAITNFNIGSLYLDLGMLDKGKKYLDRYEELNVLINNQFGHGWANEGYANFYSLKGDYLKAIEHIDSAIEIFKRLGSKMKVIDAKFMKLEILIESGRIKGVEELIEELDNYIKERNIGYFENTMAILKSKYLISINESKKALTILLGVEKKLKDLQEDIPYEVYYLIGKSLKMNNDKQYSHYFSLAKKSLKKILSNIKSSVLQKGFKNKPLHKEILSAK